MKELVLSVVQGDASQILETLKNISEAFDSLDEDAINSEEVNFKQFCELTERDYDNYDEEDSEAYLKAICIRLSYLQGLKDGKEQLLLDKEKFDSSRNSYLEKKKHSKVIGKLTQHNKEV